MPIATAATFESRAIRKAIKGKRIVRPTWEVAGFFPMQGRWSEGEYLGLNSNWRIEFDNGQVEFLPMPTMFHEEIVAFVYEAMKGFVKPRHVGRVFFAGIRVKTTGGKFRVPDIVFMLREHSDRMKNDAWEGADLVMEVVSPDDTDRDWKLKRDEYERAGIPEYWILDPKRSQISVLSLENGQYLSSGEYGRGTKAASVLLKGFEIDVSEAFDGHNA